MRINSISEKLRAAAAVLSIAFHTAPRQAIAVLLMTIGVAISGAIQPLWLRELVNAAVNRNGVAVLWVAGAVALTGVMFVVLEWIRFNVAQSLQERTNLHLDRQMAKLSLEVPGLDHQERATYQNRLALLQEQRGLLSQSLMSILGGMSLLIRALAVVVLLGSVHLVLVFLPLCGFALILTSGRAEHLRQQALTATAQEWRRTLHLFELATSATTAIELHIFRLKRELLRRHDQLWKAVDAVRSTAMVRGALIQSLGWTMFALGYASAITLVAWLVTHGAATLGDMSMTIALSAQVYGLSQGGVGLFSWIFQAIGAMRHYLWLVDYEAAVQPRVGASQPIPARLTHGIDFQHVSFRYPDTDRSVLTNITAHLPAGSTVAVVGENGAGKTTLVKLLCRFYEPTAGKITLDGIDFGDFDLTEWRSRMSAAFQDFARFEFLLREAVGVGDLARLNDTAAVEQALMRAGADGFLASFPSGLETQLGRSWDGGIELSGGQWQKIALGRAMMRRLPLVLLLDEPTASLDAHAEQNLFEHYMLAARRIAEQNGAITLLVSHRFSTLRMADLVIVLEDGQIREIGSHAELQAAQGLYAELYELQARAYR